MIRAILTICFAIYVYVSLFCAAFIGVLGAFVGLRQSEYLPASMYAAFAIASCAFLTMFNSTQGTDQEGGQ